MSLITGLYGMVKGKYSCPCQASDPGHPAHRLISILPNLSWPLYNTFV
jgi:hypothetical protein